MEQLWPVQAFTVADLTGVEAGRISERLPSGLVSNHPSRNYSYGPVGVVVATSPERAIKGAHREAGSSGAGAEAVLAAACILADALAAAGAYCDPFDAEPMPRAPEWELFQAARNRSVPRHGVTLMIVGGGGALAHAFLEAALADPWLKQALSGGTLALVDPDSYETSNLSRQTLAGGPHNLGRKKAEVTAEELLARWTGCEPPRVVPVADPFARTMVSWLEPDAIGLFPDNFAARTEAWQAARARQGRLVMFAGTEFTHGLFRAALTGSGCCLDCGPEGLAQAAAREAETNAARASCSAEVTASNVLTNAIVGALAALNLRRWLLESTVRAAQRIVTWMLPERIAPGPELPQCRCWSEKR
jgi:molybdopterin/thiamine biosynthesis adenylyltransferase